MLEARRAHALDLRRHQRAAARRARSRITPITAASPTITEITELPEEDQRAPGRLRLVATEAPADLLLAEERARERRPVARHFLELEHARTLDTDHLLLARRAIRDAAGANAMAVVHGEAGLGKTFAVETALNETDRPVLWTTVSVQTHTAVDRRDAARAAHRSPGATGSFRAIHRLVELLADRDRLIVIDESQLLNGDCIELLRYVHDQPTTRFALVLVGGNGTWRVLSAEPMLASRIFRRVRFQPLTRPEVLAQLPGYHPLFEGVDTELIGWIDDVFAHGSNLRHWAAFTLSATALAQEAGRPGLDEQIDRNVFALHTGGPDR